MTHGDKTTRRHLLRRRILAGGVLVPFAGPTLIRDARATLATMAGEQAAAARSLALEHLHTGESVELVYAVGEVFDRRALVTLDRFLRDHYSGEIGRIDPRLFDVLYELHAMLETAAPFQVISGYRSAATNAYLRGSRGGGVASRSLHMDGMAIDIRLPGVSLARVRDAALTIGGGGVGFYPREGFIHVDTGRVRRWQGT